MITDEQLLDELMIERARQAADDLAVEPGIIDGPRKAWAIRRLLQLVARMGCRPVTPPPPKNPTCSTRRPPC